MASRAFAAMLKVGPPSNRDITVERDAEVRAPDGTVLQVSSGAHPRYARNLGSGEPLATGATLHTAQRSVHHDPANPSAIVLPVTRIS
jgi:predicted acyl esterase